MHVRLSRTALMVAGFVAGIGAAAVHGAPSTTAIEINITSDSAPGWLPSESQRQHAIKVTGDYFLSLDEGQYERAYGMMAEVNRRLVPLQQFIQQNQKFHVRSGPLRQRSILKITWTKDPPSGPFPGIYAAIDIASHYANVDRHCGYVALYQKKAGDGFEVMRQESNFIDNVTAQGIEQQKSRAELDRIWARLAMNCPNYRASSQKVQ